MAEISTWFFTGAQHECHSFLAPLLFFFSILIGDILSAGGSNGGQAKETGKLARVISGREYLEKKMLEKPDCEQPEASTAKRKTNAPQKSQKMERRRR